jgi:acetyl esterase
MALHPHCKAFLDQLAAGGGTPLHQLTPDEARSRALPADLAGPEQPVHRVENRTVPGTAGPIAVRVYVPAADASLPGLVYFHGGGFVLGDLDMSDRPCRELANLSGSVVISVDYRLAPEHKFPAAVDDAYAATRYVAQHANEFGVDPRRLAVGGESAGANLATVVALMARDKGTPSIAFQLLVYPLVDFNDDSPSMREFAADHFLTRDALDYFRDHYLATPADAHNPYASPMLGDLQGLPPARIITAECDPLRDQGEAYARKLQTSGVHVALERYDGMIHPFFSLAGIIDGGTTAIADAAAALRNVRSTTGGSVPAESLHRSSLELT